jgi:exopolysaccharide biosynthesis polyprenyl glycosylphosphotransferase
VSTLSEVRAAARVEAARASTEFGRLDAARGIPAYLLVVAVLDALVISAALGVAEFGRFGSVSPSVSVRTDVLDPFSYTLAAVVIGLGWLVCLAASRSYDRRVVGLGTEEYKRVFVGSFRAAGIVAIVCFIAGLEVARGYLAIAMPVGAVALLVNRLVARQWLYRQRAAGRMCHQVLVVGGRDHILDLVRQFEAHRGSGFAVVGACLTTPVGALRDLDGIPLWGSITGMEKAVHASGADTVVVTAGPRMNGSTLRRLAWSLEDLDVDLVVAPHLADVAGTRIHIRPVANLPLLHVEEPVFDGWRLAVKRAFDIVMTLAIMVVVLPLMAAVALAIRLDDGQPVVFRQTRVGLRGKPFTVYKFRTMVVDAERRLAELRDKNEHDGVLFKIREDPRVTRVGRILRKFSLDELPQFFNVLRGDMSLVGPRPPLQSEVDQYGDDARRRLLVKPGITGLWQVSGRSGLSWYDTVRLDLSYVENWSLSADLMILLKTVRAVLRAEGAY